MKTPRCPRLPCLCATSAPSDTLRIREARTKQERDQRTSTGTTRRTRPRRKKSRRKKLLTLFVSTFLGRQLPVLQLHGQNHTRNSKRPSQHTGKYPVLSNLARSRSRTLAPNVPDTPHRSTLPSCIRNPCTRTLSSPSCRTTGWNTS